MLEYAKKYNMMKCSVEEVLCKCGTYLDDVCMYYDIMPEQAINDFLEWCGIDAYSEAIQEYVDSWFNWDKEDRLEASEAEELREEEMINYYIELLGEERYSKLITA